ncbi:MAG: hypothetical protein IKO57_06545 [Treponema sp.]|nr:hypothetical protein [Treponema sp.]MBR4630085.1 hypothetical protein [Treponema sp.]
MTVNMTINSVDVSLVDVIKSIIKTRSPKATVSVDELYPSDTDNAKEERVAQIKALCGGLSQYANPELVEKEKNAWAMAMKEKYAVR